MAKVVFLILTTEDPRWCSVGLVYDDNSYHIYDAEEQHWRERVSNDDRATDRDVWREFGWQVVEL